MRQGAPVPDPLTRSLRYRERAAECRRLAGLAISEETRGQYETLAQHYDELADAELTRANALRKKSTEDPTERT
jgi:hypothetical protein